MAVDIYRYHSTNNRSAVLGGILRDFRNNFTPVSEKFAHLLPPMPCRLCPFVVIIVITSKNWSCTVIFHEKNWGGGVNGTWHDSLCNTAKGGMTSHEHYNGVTSRCRLRFIVLRILLTLFMLRTRYVAWNTKSCCRNASRHIWTMWQLIFSWRWR
jgi:hypothetical protein